MELLLLSNSRLPGHGFLEHAEGAVRDFFGARKRIAFVPYAGVTITWDQYTQLVRDRLGELGLDVTSVHEAADPVAAVREADAVAVGGGNTFHLVKTMQETGVMTAVGEKVRAGAPFMGWSAGSNVACPRLSTTNDMPIVEPASHECLGLVTFQINPHYTNAKPEGHGGESRNDRIAEFLVANPGVVVAGLPEGTWLHRNGGRLTHEGTRDLTLFVSGSEPNTVKPGADVSYLLKG